MPEQYIPFLNDWKLAMVNIVLIVPYQLRFLWDLTSYRVLQNIYFQKILFVDSIKLFFSIHVNIFWSMNLFWYKFSSCV